METWVSDDEPLPGCGALGSRTAPDHGGKRMGRILLVEDERMLRRLGQRILTAAGHEVVIVESAEEALEAFAQADDWSLLATDLTLPGMNGLELAQRLRSESDIPVLFMTGYSKDELHAKGEVPEGSHYLMKPFGIDELQACVAGILAE